MKRIIIAVMALGLIAQVSMANGLGLFGAYWDTKDADDEIGYGAKLKLDIAPELSLEIRGSYFEFENGDTLEVIPAEVGLVFHVPMGDQLRLYAGGGAGYYFMDMDDADVDDEVGFYAVAGIEITVAEGIGLFAEAKHTWLEIEKVDDLDADIKLDGIGANVGAIITW